MWTKTVKVKFKGIETDVQVWLADSTENAEEVVRVQSMVNEYFLIQEIKFTDRDDAYDFIKNYSPALAKSFLIKYAYSEGAIDK